MYPTGGSVWVKFGKVFEKVAKLWEFAFKNLVRKLSTVDR